MPMNQDQCIFTAFNRDLHFANQPNNPYWTKDDFRRLLRADRLPYSGQRLCFMAAVQVKIDTLSDHEILATRGIGQACLRQIREVARIERERAKENEEQK